MFNRPRPSKRPSLSFDSFHMMLSFVHEPATRPSGSGSGDTTIGATDSEFRKRPVHFLCVVTVLHGKVARCELHSVSMLAPFRPVMLLDVKHKVQTNRTCQHSKAVRFIFSTVNFLLRKNDPIYVLPSYQKVHDNRCILDPRQLYRNYLDVDKWFYELLYLPSSFISPFSLLQFDLTALHQHKRPFDIYSSSWK